MFYAYHQNNSGGNFIINDKLGEIVVIEENSIENANKKAISIGIYFNGVGKNRDCECCGDRWSSIPEEEDIFNNIMNIDRFKNIYSYDLSMVLTIIKKDVVYSF
jgi:hypothetical protein